jgi:hypothetical protein
MRITPTASTDRLHAQRHRRRCNLRFASASHLPVSLAVRDRSADPPADPTGAAEQRVARNHRAAAKTTGYGPAVPFRSDSATQNIRPQPGTKPPPPAQAAPEPPHRRGPPPAPAPTRIHQGSEPTGLQGRLHQVWAPYTREGRPRPAATTPGRHPMLKITRGAAGPGQAGARRRARARRATGSNRLNRPQNKRRDRKIAHSLSLGQAQAAPPRRRERSFSERRGVMIRCRKSEMRTVLTFACRLGAT